MALLTCDDPLTTRPQRVVVAGTSGSGKSTLARRIADQLSAPYQELDALFHGPGWTRLPGFVEKVTAFTDQPTWVSEFQYVDVRDMLADRADTLVFLDYPRWLVMWRVTRRTVVRRHHREQLWNGNQEGPLWKILVDDEHIIRWAWKTHHENRKRLGPLVERGDLTVVVLRSPSETEQWLTGPLAASRFGDAP